jgi:hypothetical protein
VVLYDTRPRLRKGKFKKHIKPLVDEIRRNGVEIVDISQTGRGHLRLHWSGGNGKLETIVTSATPSDWRTVHNARAAIRRKFKGQS